MLIFLIDHCVEREGWEIVDYGASLYYHQVTLSFIKDIS